MDGQLWQGEGWEFSMDAGLQLLIWQTYAFVKSMEAGFHYGRDTYPN